MRINWFLRFLLLAICIKFIFDSLIITFIFAAIIGFSKEHQNGMRPLMLGFALGTESAVLLLIFGAFPGLAVFLNLFRSMGIPIASSLAYLTVGFVAFSYIVVFEIIFAVLVAKFTSIVAEVLEEKGLRLQW